MVCKKDFEMNPEYEGAPIEISYKAGRSYVFLKVGDRYLGFDETQTVKHEMSQDLIDEYFFKEVLGRFNVTDQVFNRNNSCIETIQFYYNLLYNF